MKRSLVGLLSLLGIVVCMPVAAQEMTASRAGDPPVFTEGTVPFAEMVRLLGEKVSASGLTPTPNVAYEGAEPYYLFPVAGSAGVFKTEAVMVNRKNSPQRMTAYYLPIGAGASNCTKSSRGSTFEAGRSYYYSDFIPTVFAESGFGSVMVFGVDSNGKPDPTALIDGSARIWSPAPGGGTASQNFPAMAWYFPGGTQSALGLRSDAAFRTNWGIFNWDTATQTFDITFNGSNGARLQIARDIPPCSLIQDRVEGGPYESLEIVFTPRNSAIEFSAYGSSVDNTSSDSFSVPARRIGGR